MDYSSPCAERDNEEEVIDMTRGQNASRGFYLSVCGKVFLSCRKKMEMSFDLTLPAIFCIIDWKKGRWCVCVCVCLCVCVCVCVCVEDGLLFGLIFFTLARMDGWDKKALRDERTCRFEGEEELRSPNTERKSSNLHTSHAWDQLTASPFMDHHYLILFSHNQPWSVFLKSLLSKHQFMDTCKSNSVPSTMQHFLKKKSS